MIKIIIFQLINAVKIMIKMTKIIIKIVQQHHIQMISLVILKMKLGMKMEMKVLLIMEMIDVGFALIQIIMKLIP